MKTFREGIARKIVLLQPKDWANNATTEKRVPMQTNTLLAYKSTTTPYASAKLDTTPFPYKSLPKGPFVLKVRFIPFCNKEFPNRKIPHT